MNVPEYHDAIQKIVNEYEEACTHALVEMKQNLIDAKRAFFGENRPEPDPAWKADQERMKARYGEEHEKARQRLLSPED